MPRRATFRQVEAARFTTEVVYAITDLQVRTKVAWMGWGERSGR
jgi:hypothetical protein